MRLVQLVVGLCIALLCCSCLPTVQGAAPASWFGHGQATGCGLTKKGVKCWGYGYYGQTGSGLGRETDLYYVPDKELNLGTTLKVVSISVGYHSTCALFLNRRLKCWGWAHHLQKDWGLVVTPPDNEGPHWGTEPGEIEKTPFINIGVTDGDGFSESLVLDYSVGKYHTLAVDFQGRIWAWGANAYGQCGRGSLLTFWVNNPETLTAPITFSDTIPAKQVSTAEYSSCALFANGKVRCWGYGGFGHTGQGTPETYGDSTTDMTKLDYIEFSDTVPAVRVDTAYSHACALFENGKVRCWGSNTQGKLGHGPLNTVWGTGAAGRSTSEIPYLNFVGGELGPLGEGVIDIQVNGKRTCVLFTDFRPLCWGECDVGTCVYDAGDNVNMTTGYDPPLNQLQIPFHDQNGDGKSDQYLTLCAYMFHWCGIHLHPPHGMACSGNGRNGRQGVPEAWYGRNVPSADYPTPSGSYDISSVWDMFPSAGPEGGGVVSIISWDIRIFTMPYVRLYDPVTTQTKIVQSAPWTNTKRRVVMPDWNLGARNQAYVNVSLSEDQVSWNETDITFLFFKEPTFYKVGPTGGPSFGKTRVMYSAPAGGLDILASRLRPSCIYDLRPTFTETVVKAQVFNDTLIVCANSPSLPAEQHMHATVSLLLGEGFNKTMTAPFEYFFHNPVSDQYANLTPTAIPSTGGIAISFTGTEFIEFPGPVKAFLSTKNGGKPAVILENPTISADNLTISFDVPDLRNENLPFPVDCFVNLAFNGESGSQKNYRLLIYNSYRLLDVVPRSVPSITGGAPISIIGSNLLSLADDGSGANSRVINAVATATFTKGASTLVVTGNPSANLFIVAAPPQASSGEAQIEVTLTGPITDPVQKALNTLNINYHTMTGIKPTGGQVGVETPVTVTGTDFISVPNLYCRFFTTLVPATVVTSTSMTCKSPASLTGTVPVEMTTDGVVFTQSNSLYTYYSSPVFLGMFPDRGPVDKPTTVTIQGAGFIVLPGTAPRCRVGAGDGVVATISLPTQRMYCQVPAGSGTRTIEYSLNGFSWVSVPQTFEFFSIYSVEPSFGPNKGGTKITIAGTGFKTGLGLPYCVFINTFVSLVKYSPATIVSPQELTCVVQSFYPVGKVLPTALEVTLTGTIAGLTGQLNLFTYFHTPIIGYLYPNRGPAQGGFNTTVISDSPFNGFDKNDAEDLKDATAIAFLSRCKFGEAQVPLTIGNLDDDPVLGNVLIVPTPPGTGTVPVEFTYNAGHEWTTDGVLFTYYDISALEPQTGPTTGGTRIVVSGSSLIPGSTISRCKFGNITVTATIPFSAQAECVSPPLSAGVHLVDFTDNITAIPVLWTSRKLNFEMYANPEIHEIVPAQGPAQGGQSVTIRGLFPAVTTPKRCRFGKIDVEASVANTSTIICQSPSGEGLVALEVSMNNGFDYTNNGTEYAFFNFYDHSPRTGPVSGGTEVVFTGSGFQDLGAGKSKCRFGAQVTAATVVSTQTVTCIAPSTGSAGSIAIELTMDGEFYTQTGRQYSYYEDPHVGSVSPRYAFDDGSTHVTVTGTDFMNVPATQCRVGTAVSAMVSYINNAVNDSIVCSTPPGSGLIDIEIALNAKDFTSDGIKVQYFSFLGIEPKLGPVIGGTNVVVSGAGFQNAPNPSCYIASTLVAANVLSDSSMTCTMPSGIIGVNNVQISMDGLVFSSTASFAYYATPTVTNITPKSVPSDGGTVITLSGANLVNHGLGARCRFGSVSVAGSVLSGSRVACNAPQLSEQVIVTVSLNNGFTWSATGQPLRPFTVFLLEPNSGPDVGGSIITVSGYGFVDRGNPKCNFTGSGEVTATIVSVDKVLCTSPVSSDPNLVSGVSFTPDGIHWTPGSTQFQYYPAPAIDVLDPVHGSSSSSVITLTGRFVDRGSNMKCLYGVDVIQANNYAAINGTHAKLECVRPASGGTFPVQLSLNLGADFTPNPKEFIAVAIDNIEPDLGPAAGGSHVVLSGTGLKHLPTSKCKFGSVEVAATLLNSAQTSCISPASPGSPDTVVPVYYSNNGVHWSEEIRTFTYFSTPIARSLWPTYSPSQGGANITVTGDNFNYTSRPVRCQFGASLLPTSEAIHVDNETVICRSPSGDLPVGISVTFDDGNTFASISTRLGYFSTLSILPPKGPMKGGTEVTVVGAGFAAHGSASCMFGSRSVPATVLSSVRAVCTAPGFDTVAPVPLEFSLMGSATIANKSYTPYPNPSVTIVHPTVLPSQAGAHINITGTNFTAHGLPIICRYGLRAVPASGVFAGQGPGGSDIVDCPTLGGASSDPVEISFNDGYDFTEDNVRVTYFILSSIEPTLGPTRGGDEVVVKGSGFLTGYNSKCRFGTVITPAVVSTAAQAVCLTAPLGAGVAGVDISITGLEAHFTAVGSPFKYYETPVVTLLSPMSGVAAGGNLVYVSGDHFVDQGEPVRCRFGVNIISSPGFVNNSIPCVAPPGSGSLSVEVSINGGFAYSNDGVQYTYFGIVAVNNLQPALGGENGGTRVQLLGSGFVDNPSTRCKFGNTTVIPERPIGSTQLTCVAPPGTGVVPVSYTPDGTTYTLSATSYTYHPEPVITQVLPANGPRSGGSTVVLRGTNMYFNHTLTTPRCRFGTSVVVGVPIADGTTYALSCITPTGVAGDLPTDVSLNAVSYTNSGKTYRYFGLSAIQPSLGPASGGTNLILSGSGFIVGSTSARCKIGTTVIPAVIVSPAQARCTTPAMSGTVPVDFSLDETSWTSTALTFFFYATPTVTSVYPPGGPVTGGTNVVISGSNLVDHGSPIKCRFGAITVSGTASGGSVSCLSPNQFGQVTLEVSLNDAFHFTENDITYSYASVARSIPVRGPIAGGTSVTVVGTGFAKEHFDNAKAKCYFGTYTPSVATWSGDLRVVCTSPEVPGVTTLDVTVRTTTGVDALPSSSAVNGTVSFAFYQPPTFGGIVPLAGPSNGGTTVTIPASGISSSATISVKFGGSLAIETSFNGAVIVCKTPPLEGDQAVRVSMNGYDYHDAGSFTFFTVLSIQPRYGPRGGGTEVAVTGSGFLKSFSATIKCRFGPAVVPATYVNSALLRCISPSEAEIVKGGNINNSGNSTGSAGSSATGSNSTAPGIRLLANGMHGSGLHPESIDGSGAMDLLQQTPGTDISKHTMAVSLDGADYQELKAGSFDTYFDPIIENIVPRESPTEGGANVTITGVHFKNFTELACKFGDDATDRASRAIMINDTALTCKSTPHVGGNVTVQVSLNGQQFKAGVFQKAYFSYEQCRAGYFARTHTETCQPCPKGEIAEIAGQTKCTNCLETQYQDQVGQSACKPCPENTYIAWNGTDSKRDTIFKCRCIPGYYHPESRTGDACSPCPAGATCDGGTKAPVAQPGFWNSADQPYAFVVCDELAACPGGGVAEEERCGEGYTGRQCSLCIDGYYKRDKQCLKCPEQSYITLVAFGIFLAIIIGLLIKVVGADASAYGGTINITAYFMQVIGLMAKLKVKWPEEVHSTMTFLSSPFTLNLDILGSECSIPLVSYEVKWAATMLMPIIFLLIFTIVYLIGKITGKGKAEADAVTPYGLSSLVDQAATGSARDSVDSSPALVKSDSSSSFEYVTETESTEDDGGSDLSDSDMVMLGANAGASASAGQSANGSGSGSGSASSSSTSASRSASASASVSAAAPGASSDPAALINEDGEGDLDVVGLKSGYGPKGTRRPVLDTEKPAHHIPPSLGDSLVNGYMLFLALAYLTLTTTAFELFDCTIQADGNYTLDANPALLCYDTWWYNLVPLGVFGVLGYGFAIPIVTFFVVYKNRTRLSEPGPIGRYGSIFLEYTKERSYWEAVVMFEKLGIALVLTFFTTKIEIQLLGFLLVLVMGLAFNVHANPFFIARYNTLQSILRWCSSVLLLAGLIFRAGNFPDLTMRKVLTAFVFIFIFGAMAFVIISILYDVYVIRKALKGSAVDERTTLFLDAYTTPQGKTQITEWLGSGRAYEHCHSDLMFVLTEICEEFGRPPPAIVVDDELLRVSQSVVREFTEGVFYRPVLATARNYVLRHLRSIRSNRSQHNPSLEDLARFIQVFTDIKKFLYVSRRSWNPFKKADPMEALTAIDSEAKLSKIKRQILELFYPDLKAQQGQAEASLLGPDAAILGLGNDFNDNSDDEYSTDVEFGPGNDREPEVDGDEEPVTPRPAASGGAGAAARRPRKKREPRTQVNVPHPPEFAPRVREESLFSSFFGSEPESLSVSPPSYWGTGKSVEPRLIALDESDHSYKEISRIVTQTFDSSKVGGGADNPHLYHSGIQVESVSRLEHHQLWREYALARLRLAEVYEEVNLPPLKPAVLTSQISKLPQVHDLVSRVHETYLFHGTSSEVCNVLQHTGFDERLSSGSNMFGTGLYFAEASSKADEYTSADENGLCTMVLARVLLGMPFITPEVQSDFVRPPCHEGHSGRFLCNHPRFDSVLAECGPEAALKKYREFVVYRATAAMPEYIIKYRRVHGNENGDTNSGSVTGATGTKVQEPAAAAADDGTASEAEEEAVGEEEEPMPAGVAAVALATATPDEKADDTSSDDDNDM